MMMKINSIPSRQDCNIKFTSGKVHLYSDFDNTYLPASHNDFARNYDKGFVDWIRGYFNDFRSFFDRNKDGLRFTITTGRTYEEFETLAETARERKIEMPLPDSLICKNGSDEYLRTGTDAEFYRGGYFPFDYKRPNPEKEAEIKQLTGWDGPAIKEKLKEIFASHNLPIVEGGSENGTHDYPKCSLFRPGSLDPKKPHEWKVGFRNDGNCKIFFTLPRNMSPSEYFSLSSDKKKVYDDIIIKIKDFLEKRGTKYLSYEKQHDDECCGRPYKVIVPDTEKYFYRTHREYDRGLSKLYDTQKAVKKAFENQDLVIVAGDSSNDKRMLNPINYFIDVLEKVSEDKDNPLSFENNEKAFIRYMDKHPELYEKFKKIPFIGIIEKNDRGNEGLSQLIEYFSKGKYQKIIVVEKGKLKEGIREAIKLYCSQNPEYKKKLSKDLLKEVFNIVEQQSSKEVKDRVEKSKLNGVAKCVIIGLLVLGTTVGGKVLWDKKHKNGKDVVYDNKNNTVQIANS